MTGIRNIKIEVFLYILAVVIISFFVFKRNINFAPVQLAIPIISGSSAQTTIVAVASPVLQETSVFQPSPDGKKKLVMKITHNKDDTLTYVFTATDGSGENQRPLYTTTVSDSENMSLPFNTWSPDNKYVFVQKHDGDVLVFKATGDDIISGQKYLDLGVIFSASPRKYTYHETTGWASPTLLIVNTVAQDNTKGASYWFEVPSKAIIQLSSAF